MDLPSNIVLLNPTDLSFLRREAFSASGPVRFEQRLGYHSRHPQMGAAECGPAYQKISPAMWAR